MSNSVKYCPPNSTNVLRCILIKIQTEAGMLKGRGREDCLYFKCPVRGQEDGKMTAGGIGLVRLVSSVPLYKGGKSVESSVRLVAPF